ncbi:unnamed protein product [Echinostoma caproni]|uniref:Lipopolysaccharide choline phosphotransferase n=1 Tax=Echinostoma caproni TaxID=27848 RepID=A0A183A7Y6_9TREM|nr:unnamed protein product [Echinostoma caproni]
MLPVLSLLSLAAILLYFWGRNCSLPKRITLDAFLVKPNMTQNAWHALPNLRQLQWPKPPCAKSPTGRKYRNGTVYPLPPAFLPVMSCGQRALSKRMLKRFSDLMFENGLGDRFILNAGTLVGSFQHHDFVPWDDDVDVLVDLGVRTKVRELLQTLEPEFKSIAHPRHDKIFAPIIDERLNDFDVQRSRKTSRLAWGWPFLDIGYFESNATHLWDQTNRNQPSKILAKLIVFPLMFRPLGLDWYPTPYDTLGFIRKVYGKTGGCSMFGYSHVLEGRGPRGHVSCWNLGRRYAFVQRTLAPPGQYEFVDSHLNEVFTVGEEILFYRSRKGPLIVHKIPIPTFLNYTDVNAYAFGDEDLA